MSKGGRRGGRRGRDGQGRKRGGRGIVGLVEREIGKERGSSSGVEKGQGSRGGVKQTLNPTRVTRISGGGAEFGMFWCV